MSLLDKSRITAPPGFNRWLVPPAALAIHLSIGMAYGFSVFWLPLSKAIGIDQPRLPPAESGFFETLFSTESDWSISMLGWMYTFFFVFLGGSAAVFGRWVERAGPRKAGVVAACCWSGGLVISAVGVWTHQILLLWLGSGVIGGIGLGLGYISPVATLIQWFPDRRGLATGLAIMGFGGGAMIGAPLANFLMQQFATPTSVGVAETFLVLGLIYFTAMMLGAFGYRLPAPEWRPPGMILSNPKATVIRYLPVERAWRTRQFWLIWLVLCLNVSAGIGILGMASPMLQEYFGGQLIDVPKAYRDLNREEKVQLATVAAGFAGFLSLCNILGRIGWASFSDRLGRRKTYTIFFLIGALLYAMVPLSKSLGGIAPFVLIFGVILSMYGGGFATIPAYLVDTFGPKAISSIHGRLLTAWSVAGVLGPLAVNGLRDLQLNAGVAPDTAYNRIVLLLAGLLLLGLVCNLLIRPVPEREFIELSPEPTQESINGSVSVEMTGPLTMLILVWGAVGLPLAWGVWNTLKQTSTLFGA
jgi:MFS family permease